MDCAGDSDDLVPPIKWEPHCSKNTKMDKLRQQISEKYSVDLKTYREFHQWSCDNYSEIWEEVFKFTDIIHSQPYSQVVDKEKNIADIPEWFPGCHLNFTENILRYDDDRVAVYTTGEGLGVSKMSFRQLRESVTRYVTALKKMGIQKGDRVVGDSRYLKSVGPKKYFEIPLVDSNEYGRLTEEGIQFLLRLKCKVSFEKLEENVSKELDKRLKSTNQTCDIL